MGRTGNGDGWSDGAGAPDDLPAIPPEWGPIVIPDDPAALAVEAELVRRELRRTRRQDRWRRRFGLPTGDSGPPGGHRPHEIAALRLPLILMLVAVLAAMAGMFTVAWPDRPSGSSTPTPTPAMLPDRPLPALDLVDSTGATVSIRSLLPAVILLVETCDCADQIAATAAAAPAGVSVVAVTSSATTPGRPPPTLAVGQPATYALADPAAGIRAFLDVEAVPDSATALLVTETGDVIRLVVQAYSVETYRADLELLVGP